MFKTLIFDRSGTLKDNFEWFVELVGMMCVEFGGEPLSAETIRQEFTLPYMKFWNKFFPDLKKEDQDPVYLKNVDKPDASSIKLFDGVKEFLDRMKEQRYQLMILTSDPHDTAMRELEQFGVKNMFSEIHTMIHEKWHTITDILERNGLAKDEVLYVGDSD